MTNFSDAALLTGDYAHMAAQFRAGDRAAPRRRDWKKVANNSIAENAAQEIAHHIFELQNLIDVETERLEIGHLTAAGPMHVMSVSPGNGEILRLDGVLFSSGEPVAQALHTSQLALTFTKAELKDDGNGQDDGLQIGFLIFDELSKRRRKRGRKIRKLSLSTSRTIKQDKQAKQAKKIEKITPKGNAEPKQKAPKK